MEFGIKDITRAAEDLYRLEEVEVIENMSREQLDWGNARMLVRHVVP